MIASRENVPYKRMGIAAPAKDEAAVSSFGGQPVVDEAAKTPAVRPFPAQGEALSQAGEYYIFRGFGGVPFRSKSKTPPDIKANDPRQPVVTADAQVRIFDLGKPDDLRDYTEVWDKAAKGYYVNPVEERQWVPEDKTWRVFMRWGVKYWQLPEE